MYATRPSIEPCSSPACSHFRSIHNAYHVTNSLSWDRDWNLTLNMPKSLNIQKLYSHFESYLGFTLLFHCYVQPWNIVICNRCHPWNMKYINKKTEYNKTWWRHQMETFSALLAIYAGNSPVSGEFLAQRPVTQSFDVFFNPRLIKRLSKHSWGWWFQTLSCPLWRHRNENRVHILCDTM